MREILNNIVINMISVNSHIRAKGMKQLKEIIGKLDGSLYNKVSYGIFYYFWFSDGFEQQQQDIA